VIRAVLLDALGTLVALRKPWPAFVSELESRGVSIDESQAEAALRAEMAYYRAHCQAASDRERLAQLRADCTEVLRSGLPPHARGVDDLQDALLGSLAFSAYPEVPGVLRALRAADRRLVVVSNWDISLHDVLAQTGLRELLDGVVTSAEAGASKPDPAIFARGLETAGVGPDEALHVGDDLETDVAGARAAGIRAVWVCREDEVSPSGRRNRRLENEVSPSGRRNRRLENEVSPSGRRNRRPSVDVIDSLAGLAALAT
jgi:putative hydrolase of the HAD superfamily